MPMDHAEEIRELTERVRGYERSYRIDAQSQISDYEYDQLVSRLRELERQFPELSLPDSPTRMVGDDRTSGFRKVTHRVPMLSLENTYSLEDLEAFDRRVRAWLRRGAVDRGLWDFKRRREGLRVGQARVARAVPT